METNKIDLTGSRNNVQQNIIPQGFNLGLLIYILNKSVLWMILIISLCIFASLIYLRYTPRVYQASARMILQAEKSTQILGIENLVFEKDQSEINREMEVLKSPMLMNIVADQLPLDVSYFKEGKSKFITEDLYKSSPFKIFPSYINPDIYGVPLYIKFLDKSKIILSFSFKGAEYEKEFYMNDTLVTPYFKAFIAVENNKLEPSDFSSVYFFKFNDRQTLISELISKISIEPIDVGNRTLVITCRDVNPERSKD
ncbi:MAG: Wzz/FepE/Etk N-terminal domain-containing protein, partial [Chitinophagales bacterium]|nr:Wzz/FepE/Etk N-terminal domain-containing protein [Chitinophagales bacterium]